MCVTIFKTCYNESSSYIDSFDDKYIFFVNAHSISRAVKKKWKLSRINSLHEKVKALSTFPKLLISNGNGCQTITNLNVSDHRNKSWIRIALISSVFYKYCSILANLWIVLPIHRHFDIVSSTSLKHWQRHLPENSGNSTKPTQKQTNVVSIIRTSLLKIWHHIDN